MPNIWNMERIDLLQEIEMIARHESQLEPARGSESWRKRKIEKVPRRLHCTAMGRWMNLKNIA